MNCNMENKSLVDIPPSYVSGELTQLAHLYKFIKKEKEKTFKESSKLEINGYIYAKKDRKLLQIETRKIHNIENNEENIKDKIIKQICQKTGLTEKNLMGISIEKNTKYSKEASIDDIKISDVSYLFTIDYCNEITLRQNEQWINIDEVYNNPKYKNTIEKICNILKFDFKIPKIYI